MSDLYTNFAFCRITSSITSTATSINVDDTSSLPSASQMAAQNFYMTFDSLLVHPSTFEIVQVTNVSGSTLTLVRGVEGTTAQAHSNGCLMRGSLTAGMISRFYPPDRVIIDDYCDTSVLPTSVTTSGTVSYDSTTNGRIIGQGTSGTSIYNSGAFNFQRSSSIQIWFEAINAASTGNFIVSLFTNAATPVQTAYFKYQSDNNEIPYKADGSTYGTTPGTGSGMAAGDYYMFKFVVGNSNLEVQSWNKWLTYDGGNSPRANGYSTNSTTITDGTSMFWRLSTDTTRQIRLFRIRAYAGPPT